MNSMSRAHGWRVGGVTSYTAQTPHKPRFVAGVLGPTSRTASISPDVNDPGFRNVQFDELVADYLIAIRGLTDGGADLLLVETVFDTLNAKAALFAIEQFFETAGRRWPVMISGTITDASGRTLSGQTAEAFWNSLRHARPLTFGLNCALGANELRQYVAELSGLCDCFVSAHPNAGLPNAFGGYDETPEMLAASIREWGHGGKKAGWYINRGGRLLRYNTGSHPGDCNRAGGLAAAGAAGLIRRRLSDFRAGAVQHR